MIPMEETQKDFFESCDIPHFIRPAWGLQQESPVKKNRFTSTEKLRHIIITDRMPTMSLRDLTDFFHMKLKPQINTTYYFFDCTRRNTIAIRMRTYDKTDVYYIGRSQGGLLPFQILLDHFLNKYLRNKPSDRVSLRP